MRRRFRRRSTAPTRFWSVSRWWHSGGIGRRRLGRLRRWQPSWRVSRRDGLAGGLTRWLESWRRGRWLRGRRARWRHWWAGRGGRSLRLRQREHRHSSQVVASQGAQVPVVLDRAREREDSVARRISRIHFTSGSNHITNKQRVDQVRPIVVILKNEKN